MSYYDTSVGVNPVLKLLPKNMQNKWRDKAVNYKKTNNAPFPPFDFFVKFVHDIASSMNDPAFNFDTDQPSRFDKSSTRGKLEAKPKVSVKKTAVTNEEKKTTNDTVLKRCIIHKASHSLNDCKAFKEKSVEDRRQLLKENGICFKCLLSKDHHWYSCPVSVICESCGSRKHPTGMHISKTKKYGGESSSPDLPSTNSEADETQVKLTVKLPPEVNSKRTNVENCDFQGRSCAKISLVDVYVDSNPSETIRVYAILDDQSNQTLAKPSLFKKLKVDDETIEYKITSCAGSKVVNGRFTNQCSVSSTNGSTSIKLRSILECKNIPNNRSEIPTPEVADHFTHLKGIKSLIPPIDNTVEIELLIGRDSAESHHVLDQIVGPSNTPFAQKLPLGWVIVGEVCVNKLHIPDQQTVTVNKTNTVANGRTTLFQPCPNNIQVKECYRPIVDENCIGQTVFEQTKEDNQIAPSIEDKLFLQIMDEGFRKNEIGNWEAPLPFRPSRSRLPNNRSQALHRAKLLDCSLQKNSTKKDHFEAFMKKVIASGAAEVAPEIAENDDRERWYLPLFGVYHPKKKDKIRGVFDSSALFNNISLNNVLLKGPDLINSLQGILLRFRRDRCAVMADIEQMFYSFYVTPNHRDYLRFFWYRDNDTSKDIIEYRMRVHVFGNTPSPSVAMYGLRKCVENQEIYNEDIRNFINNNFYVDDGLMSHSSEDQIIRIIKETQNALRAEGNIRLHKICSNNVSILNAFPSSDLSTSLMSCKINTDELPMERSLGIVWNTEKDTFDFDVQLADKPFTRRGVLSVVNSIFDPLGFIAPITVKGKMLLREFMTNGLNWDDTFQDDEYTKWKVWRDSLSNLKDFHIPRSSIPDSQEPITSRELHVFSDASEKAIAAVAYLRLKYENGTSSLGFLYGKAKVAPTSGHTIPRLELCAAVMAVDITEMLVKQLDVKLANIKYYTDSRVVLGYIQNEKRRFYVYVSNRVDRIRRSSNPSQWNYVPTDINPADQGTRTMHVSKINNSLWLLGPSEFLTNSDSISLDGFELVDPTEDPEIRPDTSVSVMKTRIDGTSRNSDQLGTDRYNKFSSWKRLVRAVYLIKVRIRKVSNSVDIYQDAQALILKSVQCESYEEEIHNLKHNRLIQRTSKILSLNPYLDEDGLLRVGGRLNKIAETFNEKNPIFIPGRHYISTLLVRHFHEDVKHMGRHMTDGAIRSGGFWITGVKRLINSLIHRCVICKKLRGNLLSQKMADLPEDRLEAAPAFTNVGLDVFGPWNVITRKTRGGQSNSKRWVIIFTCLVTRAVHFEVIEEMTSSAFINALRRFIAIRGKVKVLRSDRGTNFIGSTDDLKIDAIKVEDQPIKHFLYNMGTVWMFNPPHFSHMGGVWERLIGVARKIIDSIILNSSCKNLTHDVLVTLMAEVSAIMNSRPLVPVSVDPDSPCVLSPSTLLTMKTDQSVKIFEIDEFTSKEQFKSHWKLVQHYADQFWSRWRKEYLSTLQSRRKWQTTVPNLKIGDVVLLKDNTVHRNEWPIGRVVQCYPSSDGCVRKVQIRISKDGNGVNYTRPVNELIYLLSD